MSDTYRSGHSEQTRPGESLKDVTDAPADIGDTTDLAEPDVLENERIRRLADDQPDLPDRAFDRITPQV